MKRILLLTYCFIVCFDLYAQKKQLDHSVYDSWQRIAERTLSPDGKWVIFTIDPQEGDNELVIQSIDGKYKKVIERGYNATITRDSRFAVFKIRAFYKDIRQARVKKLKTEDFPKDSLGLVELGREEIWKRPRLKSFKVPEESFGWIAYQLEKPADAKKIPAGNKTIDSLSKLVDSLKLLLTGTGEFKKQKKKKDGEEELNSEDDKVFAEGDETAGDQGQDLFLRNLFRDEEKIFPNVLEYYFSKYGDKLLVEQGKLANDPGSKPSVSIVDLKTGNTKTISKGGNDFKNFAFSEDGSQVAFVAERDAKPKDQQKFYKLWLFKPGMDSASMVADKHSTGMRIGMTVSEFGTVSFSKSGKRLFFGTSPIQPAPDTSIAEIDIPKLDIWHYNDEYLQTVQTLPTRLRNDQQQNFLAVVDLPNNNIIQLATREIPQVIMTSDGDGERFIGVTDFGKRVEAQWSGVTRKDIYAINANSGDKKMVRNNLHGQAYPSSTGKYILFYDRSARHYYSWDGDTARKISAKIKQPLWNEKAELPDDPNPYGVMRWADNDDAVFVYDRYSVWKLDPSGQSDPVLVLDGRPAKKIYRYVQVNPEERSIKSGQPLVFRSLNEINKESGLHEVVYSAPQEKMTILSAISPEMDMAAGVPAMSRNGNTYLYTLESFNQSPDLYARYRDNAEWKSTRLSSINPQQKYYYWGSAELITWKAYNGKESAGIVYKPENFDPKKKYPMIVYFYEDLSDNLHTYHAPAPIRSAVNIPFFVSRGYVVFLPDIHYGTGHPGKDAYNYIVSGTRAVVKKGFVDSTRMAIQGHSWGGYQVAQLITMTNLYKAAWAGAPVANMTSAYGGIRWESGLSRQFQYEKTQSRLGASLWDNRALYIENSPLFHLDKVKTPLVIMHNDADGAVPWYQGIELFTALRRLGKKVWMFNYNGQGHGLTQRQDMKDYQVRMQQFFDWILKDQPPAKWITEGVPATRKGKDLGLDSSKF